jgi:hypothetical protein
MILRSPCCLVPTVWAHCLNHANYSIVPLPCPHYRVPTHRKVPLRNPYCLVPTVWSPMPKLHCLAPAARPHCLVLALWTPLPVPHCLVPAGWSAPSGPPLPDAKGLVHPSVCPGSRPTQGSTGKRSRILTVQWREPTAGSTLPVYSGKTDLQLSGLPPPPLLCSGNVF